MHPSRWLTDIAICGFFVLLGTLTIFKAGQIDRANQREVAAELPLLPTVGLPAAPGACGAGISKGGFAAVAAGDSGHFADSCHGKTSGRTDCDIIRLGAVTASLFAKGDDAMGDNGKSLLEPLLIGA
jgi:hypothetical protein